jgi:lipopolysaccharide/colanic/teichoic acid biosynthesis glycosyltransferase
VNIESGVHVSPARELDTSGPVSRRGRSAFAHEAKRLLDLALAIPLCVAVVPLFAVIALAIKLDSRGPVFYRCRRVGFRGRPLAMLKFRKMADGVSGPALTSADDSRFTRCGRLLAATKLDELPQLWHVLTGEMSLVGPRPEDPEFVELHKIEYAEILQTQPGITGLCQLAFARETKLLNSEDRVTSYIGQLLPAKVRIDLLYARRRSMRMDLRILVWTAVAVLLRQEVAVDRASGRLTLRRRKPARRVQAAEQATGGRAC